MGIGINNSLQNSFYNYAAQKNKKENLPLTQEELALAKAQRLKNAGERFIDAWNGNCKEEQAETWKALDEAGGFTSFTQFMPIKPLPAHFVRDITFAEDNLVFEGSTPIVRSNNGFNLPSYIDLMEIVGQNNFNIGNKSIVSIRELEIHLAVRDNPKQVSVHCANTGKAIENINDEMRSYVDALHTLIFALENSDRDFFALTNPDSVSFLLQNQGIDTKETFWLNGKSFKISGNSLIRTNERLI